VLLELQPLLVDPSAEDTGATSTSSSDDEDIPTPPTLPSGCHGGLDWAVTSANGHQRLLAACPKAVEVPPSTSGGDLHGKCDIRRLARNAGSVLGKAARATWNAGDRTNGPATNSGGPHGGDPWSGPLSCLASVRVWFEQGLDDGQALVEGLLEGMVMGTEGLTAGAEGSAPTPHDLGGEREGVVLVPVSSVCCPSLRGACAFVVEALVTL